MDHEQQESCRDHCRGVCVFSTKCNTTLIVATSVVNMIATRITSSGGGHNTIDGLRRDIDQFRLRDGRSLFMKEI